MRSRADEDAGRTTYDGVAPEDLARLAGVPRALVFSEVGSTLDAAHTLAADGVAAGTLVLADAQTKGRGRGGRSWSSHAGAGVWLTLVERPGDASALAVLSLRVGLELAKALDQFAGGRVGLKWPNDLYFAGRKLGGILVEARWRDSQLEWVAIGVGINVHTPTDQPRAIGLRDHASRTDVLAACVPVIRRAAAQVGCLTPAEHAEFDSRDIARGRDCVSPLAGVVQGIDACGALLVALGSERVAVRSGSLIFREEEGSSP